MNTAPVLWKPSEEFIENSNLRNYENWLQANRNLSFSNYHELWQWSVDNIEDFWGSLWEYFQIISHAPYSTVLSSRKMPGTKWFEGSTLNYAEHVFRQKSAHRPAICFKTEDQPAVEISWGELEDKVVALRSQLKQMGVGPGDCVAAYLPNIPEAIIAFLAINSLGAVWSCCSPDFGVNTVIDRFIQIEPKVFIAIDGYQYNGKIFNRLNEVKEIKKAIPSIRECILITKFGEELPDDFVSWEDLFRLNEGDELTFEPVPFEHPIWVLFSSGTTGRPKAITHSHGGVLMEHLKYMTFHNDVHPGENFFWFTTTGWMMWNFLQASLLAGATAVLYDGSPGYPNLSALWKFTASLPIHHFGTSAPYLVACMKRKLNPGKEFDLQNLRSIGSTGAPLPPEAFDWVYQSVSENVWLCSMSGGTDVCTAFVGGCPYAPVYRGVIQCRGLGCDLQAFNDNGESVKNELGEMVITKPMPSMPVFFWNDPNNERYHSSYFEKFEGKWCHGDWIRIFDNHSLTIQGRSDATLNRKGVRIGTAEIYAALDGLPGIKDSLILNLEKGGGDDIMPLFVVLKEGRLTESLVSEINRTLKEKCSPRHVPDVVIPVPDVPYTLSGKKMEVPVKKILLGMDGSKTVSKDTVRNPEAIDYFKGLSDEFREQYLE